MLIKTINCHDPSPSSSLLPSSSSLLPPSSLLPRCSLRWVDIEGKKLFKMDPSRPTASIEQWDLPKRPGCLALRKHHPHSVLLALEVRGHGGGSGRRRRRREEEVVVPIVVVLVVVVVVVKVVVVEAL